jgi:hypothetical protein
MAAASVAPRDSVGAGALGFGEHVPALPGLLQDWPGGQEISAQQVLSTQLPDMHWAGLLQASPFGRPGRVGVAVSVVVGVPVGVRVGVTVGV